MDVAALDQILEALERVVEADLMVILAVEDANTLRACAARGRLATPAIDGLLVRLDERPALARVVRGSSARIIHDDETHDVHEPDTYADVLSLPDSHTCLAAPLRVEGQLVGVLTLDAMACHAFSEQQLRAIGGFAELAARVLYEQQRAERIARELDAVVSVVGELRETGAAGAVLVGRSSAWRAVVERARLVAPTPAAVLITGETGTGKEQIARAIHQWSPRVGGPFVALNCSALVPELALSEMFGHEKGAFTGADRRRLGRFELAAGGTLFLDEVADLPPVAQAQLLRVVQERTFERVGGAGAVLRSDVRLLAATHKHLPAEIAAGRFRADLYYRLNTFPIEVPPLRERVGDVALLVAHFVGRLREELDMPRLRVSGGAVRVLERQPWPGNVRELRNALERAAILAGGRTIKPEHLDIGVVGGACMPAGRAGGDLPLPAGLRRLDAAVAREILLALQEAGGRIAGAGGAAELLGVKPTTLHSMMKRLGIRRARR